jgi:hypothetical protein
MKTDPDRAIFSNGFEVEGWMLRVRLQEFEAAVGVFLNGPWKLFKRFPECR